MAIRKYFRQFDPCIRHVSSFIKKKSMKPLNMCLTAFVRISNSARIRLENSPENRETMNPLQLGTIPGFMLGHKYIPVRYVGYYIPGRHYPAFDSAYMSTVTALVMKEMLVEISVIAGIPDN